MPGFNSSPGNFNERKNHEKFSVLNRSGRALPVEGDFGLDQLLARWRSSARYECFGSGAITRSGTGELAPHN